MRLSESDINPLPDFLNSIPDEGVELSTENLARIALFFNSGGVCCETWEDVFTVLHIFVDQRLITLTKKTKAILLNKVPYVN